VHAVDAIDPTLRQQCSLGIDTLREAHGVKHYKEKAIAARLTSGRHRLARESKRGSRH
jgi:hypothetical protein